MRRLVHWSTALVVVLLAARGGPDEIQKSGPEVFPGKNELSAHLGYQAGFGGLYQNPSGLKLTAEYAYRFQQLAWFDVQLSNVFGFGSTAGFCANTFDGSLCYRGGWAFGIAGGVKLKWTTPVPVVVETPILVGVDILYNRDCGDNGAAAPLLRTGVSVKYFLTKKIGLGAGINFAFAPAFHGSGVDPCRRTSYTDFYGTFEFALSAEFLL
jgi:hypothetical protein